MIPNMYKIAGRTHQHGVPRRRPRPGRPRALHLRRPQRRDGRALHRLRHAGLQLRPGSHGHGADRPGRHPGIAHPLPALLRRLPHLARSRQGRAALGRRPARHDRREIWCRPTARARSLPTVPSSAAPRRTPTSTSRRAKPATLTTWPPPPSCRTRWTSSPAIVGRQYHLFDYVGAPDAERVIIMMGSGAEVAHEAVEALQRRRREGRPAQSPPVPALRRRDLRRRPSRHREIHRRARPHQGTRRHRRAALLRRHHGARRNGRCARR